MRESDVLYLMGVEYLIPFTDVPIGGSVFLPTTASKEQVQAALREMPAWRQLRFVVHMRRERGMYGARIWRTF